MSHREEFARDAWVADPVQRYFAEIRRFSVLTPDEEIRLSREYRATESKVAETQLVNANLRLVVKIAMEYQVGRAALLDLIQEGNVGLLHGIRKFDPDRSIRLASYAQWWIRAYILKYLMDSHKLVKVGTTQAQRKLFYNLKREKDRLLRQGLVPTPNLLARSLAVRDEEVREMEVRLSGRESSLDAPLEDGERGSLGDLIPSQEAPLEEVLAGAQLNERLMEHLSDFASSLQGRDADIWKSRMVSDEPETLQSIGDRFGVSRERARQLEARIVKKLTHFLGERNDEAIPFAAAE
jgi:RNA polymerase sigma-32 factor